VERKALWRKQLASLSFSEKVKILEKLRERSISIAASELRHRSSLRLGIRDSEPETSKPHG